MISKSSRLNRSEIDNIKQSPLKYRGGGMLVLYQKNTLNQIKIAVVVSKKISKLAVQRNHLKRIIVDSISLELKKHPHLSYSLILYPSQAFVHLSPLNKTKTISSIFEYLCEQT